jgi:hypothetical protein
LEEYRILKHSNASWIISLLLAWFIALSRDYGVILPKEHPGYTRGYGNRPWKHALKSMANRHGKKRKHDELFKDYKKRCRIFCRLIGKRCTSHFKGIYKNRCKNNNNNYWSNKEKLWSCIALVGIVVVTHPQLL